MSQGPFFSIIIPTKNRGHIIEESILALLRQTFTDWELILVDNDDTDATKDAFEKFDDPRLRRLKTGGFSMVDNWQHGIPHARGSYILVQEDKTLLRQRALEKARAVIQAHNPDFLGWRIDCIIDNETPPRIAKSKTTGEVIRHDSRELIELFVAGLCRSGYRPSPNYGCIRRELVERIMAGKAGRLCLGVDPAFSAAVQILAGTEAVHLFDESLFVHGNNQLSTGKNFEAKTGNYHTFTKDNGGGETIYYNFVPLKLVSVVNQTFNEYCRVRSLLGEEVLPPIDMVTYFVRNYAHFWRMKDTGIDTADYVRQWNDELAKQPEKVRQEVATEIKKAGGAAKMGSASLGRRLRRSLGIDKAEGAIKRLFRRKSARSWPFKSPLEYVIWEDEQEAKAAASARSSAE
jgi:glycosyltransferase involved in cell wall biosynthesis